MKVLVMENKGNGTLVKIECSKMAKRIVSLAQNDRAEAITEALAKGRVISKILEHEIAEVNCDLLIRESGTCWDLM